LEYYNDVSGLYIKIPELQPQLKELGQRIFDIALNFNRVQLLKKVQDDFELDAKESYLPIKKRSLELIENKQWNEFKALTENFDLLKNFSGDEDFMNKLYYIYQNLVLSHEYEETVKIPHFFHFSTKYRLAPVRMILQDLLLKEDNEKTLKVLQLFNIKPTMMSKEFVDTYGELPRYVRKDQSFENNLIYLFER